MHHERPPLSTLLENAGRAKRYLGELVDRQWPGGTADRVQPAALEWLRRWQPQRVTVTPPDGAAHN
jgi:hypothetical protein